MKLQIKVPLLIVGVLAAIGLVTGAIIADIQRRSSNEQFQRVAFAMASSVEMLLEQDMLSGNREHIRETISRVVTDPLLSEIIIYDVNGVIAFSGNPSEVGTTRTDPKTLASLQSNEPVGKTHAEYGAREYDVTIPVFNRPACYACHDPARSKLGAIEVGIDTSFWYGPQKRQTILVALSSGIAFLLVGGMLVVGLRRTVLNRLGELGEAAQRISQGDYSARAGANGSDEVGVVMGVFNHMAARVEDQTRQLAQWNAQLEERVARRTRELSAINAALSAASGSLNLGEALGDAIDVLLRVTGMHAGGVTLRDAQTGRMAMVAHRGFSRKLVERLQSLPVDQGLVAHAIEQGETLVFDLSQDPHITVAEMREEGFLTGVATLVRGREGILGILGLASKQEQAATQDDIRLLETVASHIGVVIDNIVLYQREQEQRAEAQTLAASLTQETARLLEARQGILQLLLTAVEARDPYTRGHSDRVREYARAVARRLDLDKARVETISQAAHLHDLGKIGVSDTVLLKPGRLTPPEWAEVMRHSERGEEMIRLLGFLGSTLPIVRGHHERYDGAGYPDNLAADEIPLGARILAVADAYDALTTNRPYRQSYSHEEALRILQEGAGKQWDPDVVAAFQEVLGVVTESAREDEGHDEESPSEISSQAGPA